MIGKRCNRNLRDVLVSLHIRYSPAPSTDSKNPSGWKVCNNTYCMYNSYLDKSGAATIATTNCMYVIPQHTSSMSNNLIYLITCTKCGLQYMCQTKCPLNKCFYEYFREIKHDHDDTAPQNTRTVHTCETLHQLANTSHHSHYKMDVKVLEFINHTWIPQKSSVALRAQQHEWCKNSLAAEEQSRSS